MMKPDSIPSTLCDQPPHPSRLVRWLRRLPWGQLCQQGVFLLGPWLCFLMVEILNRNNPFTALSVTQVALNLAWYYTLFVLVRLLTGRNLLSGGISALLCFLAGLANHYVLTFRGRIIFPCDILGFRTALNVAGNYDYTPTAPVWGAAAILAAYLLLLLLCTIRLRPRGRRPVRPLAIVAVLLAIAVYGYAFFCTAWLPSIGIWAQQWKTQANGFLLNFMSALRYSFVTAPEDYSKDAAAALAAKYPAQAGDDAIQTPENLIIIMNEAFADMEAAFPQLELSEDPLDFYHSLTKNTIRGSLVTPVTGGGTANVEFEALTGASLAFLPTNTVAYQLYLYDGIPSLVSELKALQYEAIAFHPYLSSGWNRTSVYPWMGFDQQYYEEAVVEREDIRQYVSDSCNYRQLYRYTEETQGPTFLFNVTMQNHSGYTQGWKNLDRSVTAAIEADKSASTQFFSLMEASDQALQELIEYYEACGESTMIVFFGDHQPALSTEFYQELYGKPLDQRTTEEVLRQYETPFFIWANYDLPERQNLRISSNYLSTLTRQAAGLPLSGWDTLLGEMMEVLPVATTVGFVTGDGEIYASAQELPQLQRQLYEDYRILAYNYLFDEKNHPEGFFSPSP